MKFVLIANYLPHVTNFRDKLLEAISNLGYEIHVLAPDLEHYLDECNQLVSKGYHLHPIPLQRTSTDPLVDIQTLIYTYRLLRKIKPDAILSYTIKPVIYGTLAAWLARVPKRFFLLSGLGCAFQNSGQNSKTTKLQQIVYALYKQALSKATATFFQNPDDLKLFEDLSLVNDKSKTVVVSGSGVDVSDFNIVDFPKDVGGKIKPSFLLVARLLKDKGIVKSSQLKLSLKK